MSRIPPVDRNTTNESVRKNFDAIQKQLGVVPNIMRTMAQSPSVLEGYLGFAAALRRGRLPVALHEQIAIAVAETNRAITVSPRIPRLAVAQDSRMTSSQRLARPARPTRRLPPRSSSREPSSSVAGMFVTRTSRVSAPPSTPMVRLRKSSRTWR